MVKWEFGKNAPTVCPEELTNEDRMLINTVFEKDYRIYEEHQRNRLRELDVKYDIPMIEAKLDYSYKSLVRMLKNECKNIPKRLVDVDIAKIAASKGNIDVVEYCFSRGLPLSGTLYLYALKSKNINFLKFLFDMDKKRVVESNNTKDCRLCCEAVNNGNLDYLKYLIELGCMYRNERVFTHALLGGKIDCIKFLYENKCPYDKNNCLEYVARKGNLDCLMFLCEIGCKTSSNIFSEAAKSGNVECLKYLHHINVPTSYKTFNSAAEYDHYDCLVYLNEIKCEIKKSAVRCAISGGNL